MDTEQARKYLNSLSKEEFDKLKGQVEKSLPWKPKETQISAYLSKADELFFGGIAASGKAVALTSDLLTVYGWKTQGTVEVGDVVRGMSGWVSVVALSEVMYDRECYEISFSDGESIVADAEHQWKIEEVGDSESWLSTTEVMHAISMYSGSAQIAVRNVSGDLVLIDGIHPVESVPVRCIQVDSEDGIYYIGKHPKQTHNSDLLLGLALTQHRNSLLLRPNATELGALVTRFQVIKPDDWHWRGIGAGGQASRKTKDNIDTIDLFGVDNEADMAKIQGRASDLIGFDEVCNFKEEVYTFIIGWNRPRVPGQRCRVVAASNPPINSRGDWVIKRWRAWLDPTAGNMAMPGELRWYSMIGDKEEEFEDGSAIKLHGQPYLINDQPVFPKSRTFIPGKMLKQMAEEGYAARLAGMPEPYRSALLTGNFALGRLDDINQLIPSAWIRAGQERWEKRKENKGELQRGGYDVARSLKPGGDKATLAKLFSNRFIDRVVTVPGTATPDGTSACKLMIDNGITTDIRVNVDAIGVGSAVVDIGLLMGLNIFALVVSNSTTWRDEKQSKFKFANVRAAMWWNLRCLLDPERGPEETRLAIPPDSEVFADLAAINYTWDGLIRLETKSDIRDRIGRSPDIGDAIAMACWDGNRGILVM